MWIETKKGVGIGIIEGKPSGSFYVLASYHHPMSHTWRFCIYLHRKAKFSLWKMNGFGSVRILWFQFSWQQHCWKRR